MSAFILKKELQEKKKTDMEIWGTVKKFVIITCADHWKADVKTVKGKKKSIYGAEFLLQTLCGGK